MKKVYQTKFGSLEGNCYEACLASIFEVDINIFPGYKEEAGVWYFKYKEWLRGRGYDFLAIQNWKKGEEIYRPKVYAIVSGKSPRGLFHSVVYFDGEMVHDPHPDGGGVKNIIDWIYIVGKNPKLNNHP